MRCASNELYSPPFPLVQLDTPTIDYEPINAAGEELKSGIDRLLVRKLPRKELKFFLEIIGKRRMDNDSHPNLKNILVNRTLVSLLYFSVRNRFSHSIPCTCFLCLTAHLHSSLERTENLCCHIVVIAPFILLQLA